MRSNFSNDVFRGCKHKLIIYLDNLAHFEFSLSIAGLYYSATAEKYIAENCILGKYGVTSTTETLAPSEIMQNNGHYAVQGAVHGVIAVILATDFNTNGKPYPSIMIIYLLSCIVSNIWRIIGPIALDRKFLCVKTVSGKVVGHSLA